MYICVCDVYLCALICVHIISFFIHLSIYGHLGSFYILAIINNAAVTIWVHKSF